MEKINFEKEGLVKVPKSIDERYGIEAHLFNLKKVAIKIPLFGKKRWIIGKLVGWHIREHDYFDIVLENYKIEGITFDKKSKKNTFHILYSDIEENGEFNRHFFKYYEKPI